MFGIFKTSRVPAHLAQAGPPTSEKCRVSTCTSTLTWECTYTDTSGLTCGEHFCPDHLLVVDGAPFCRRHAGVASLLLTRVGTLLEMPVPRVDDRCLPLLLRIAAQLDDRIVQVLQHLYAGRYDVQIGAHAHIRDYRDQGRIAGWQAQWTATAQSGHLTVISLRSNNTEPPVVEIARDGRVLMEGAPEWVLRHDEDRWNGPADTDFVEALFGALVASFSAPVPASGPGAA